MQVLLCFCQQGFIRHAWTACVWCAFPRCGLRCSHIEMCRRFKEVSTCDRPRRAVRGSLRGGKAAKEQEIQRLIFGVGLSFVSLRPWESEP